MGFNSAFKGLNPSCGQTFSEIKLYSLRCYSVPYNSEDVVITVGSLLKVERLRQLIGKLVNMGE